MSSLRFSVTPVAPFRLDLTAMALKRRPVNRIDNWDGETYSRVLLLQGAPLLIEVRQTGDAHSPRLWVTAKSVTAARVAKSDVRLALNRLLGLQLDLGAFYRFARSDPRLAPLVKRFAGLKPPRFPSVFEAIVNGIACQQLSLHVGLTLLGRLSEKAGVAIGTSSRARFSFPSPETLRVLPVRGFRALGFSAHKATAIIALSQEVHSRAFDPEALRELGNEEAIVRLRAHQGIGRWTAEYVLLRGLGRTDVFPGDDVGARKHMRRWLKLHADLDYAGVTRRLAKWAPFSGLLYFHLLLDGLEKSGTLAAAHQTREAA